MTRSAETYTSYLHGPACMCTCIYLFTHTTYRYIHTCVYVCIHTQYQYIYIYIYIIYIYMLGNNALKMGKSPQRMIVHAILWSTYNHLCLEGRGSLGYIYIYIYIRFMSSKGNCSSASANTRSADVPSMRGRLGH